FSAAASKRGSELVQGYDVVPRLGEIRVPTLVLTGRDDFIAPPSQASAYVGGSGMPSWWCSRTAAITHISKSRGLSSPRYDIGSAQSKQTRLRSDNLNG